MCSCSAPAPDQHDGLDSGVSYQTLTVILFGYSLASASTQHGKSGGDGECAHQGLTTRLWQANCYTLTMAEPKKHRHTMPSPGK